MLPVCGVQHLLGREKEPDFERSFARGWPDFSENFPCRRLQRVSAVGIIVLLWGRFDIDDVK